MAKKNKKLIDADPEAGPGDDIPLHVIEQAFEDEKEADKLDAEFEEMLKQEKGGE